MEVMYTSELVSTLVTFEGEYQYIRYASDIWDYISPQPGYSTTYLMSPEKARECEEAYQRFLEPTSHY